MHSGREEALQGAHAFADQQLIGKLNLQRDAVVLFQAALQRADDLLAHLRDGDVDGRQRRGDQPGGGDVIHADHGNIPRHPEAVLVQAADGGDGRVVVGTEDGGGQFGVLLQELLCGLVAAEAVVFAEEHIAGRDGEPLIPHDALVRPEAALASAAADIADAPVPAGDQVLHGGGGGGVAVADHLIHFKIGEGQAAVNNIAVPLVEEGHGLRILKAAHDDSTVHVDALDTVQQGRALQVEFGEAERNGKAALACGLLNGADHLIEERVILGIPGVRHKAGQLGTGHADTAGFQVPRRRVGNVAVGPHQPPHLVAGLRLGKAVAGVVQDPGHGGRRNTGKLCNVFDRHKSNSFRFLRYACIKKSFA